MWWMILTESSAQSNAVKLRPLWASDLAVKLQFLDLFSHLAISLSVMRVSTQFLSLYQATIPTTVMIVRQMSARGQGPMSIEMVMLFS